MTKVGESLLVTVPRAIADGSFLWKTPFHSSGDPERRFFNFRADGKADGRGDGRADGSRWVDVAYGGPLPPGAALPHGFLPSAVAVVRLKLSRPITVEWRNPKKRTSKAPKDMMLDDCDTVRSGTSFLPLFILVSCK